jgi:DNA-binding response OmpR family regulator
MLTNEKDADMVRQVVALGVDDYLVKPLSAARIGARVSRAIAEHGLRPRAGGTPASAGWLAGVSLLVDADAEFREFFKATVSPHGSALTAESGVEAMRLCSDVSPQTLFVGSSIGLLTPPLFVKRLRANRLLDRLAIYMVTSDAERAHWGEIDGVQGYLTKTFVADALMAQLRRVLGRPGAHDQDFCDSLVTAAEQAFGMMLSVEVEKLAGAVEISGDGYAADTRLTDNGDDPGWTVALQCTAASARTIAAAFRNVPVEALSEDDVRGAIGELSHIIAGRVRHTMRERGMDLQAAAPAVRATPLSAPERDGASPVVLRGGGATIRVALARAPKPAGVAG